MGADPFGPTDAGLPRLVRNRIRELQDHWDIIMYHHCVEHVERPAHELGAASQRRRPAGRVLVRIPLADSDAFERYGTRWVQLDALRHRAIPTARGMALLAACHGLRVVDEWRDSSAFQFWGSELYLRDIPLQSERALPKVVFGRAQLSNWQRIAAELNVQNRGDQGAFVLESALSPAERSSVSR